MKVAIISDIHDNLANLAKFLSWAEKNFLDLILCCGDITNSDTLKFLSSFKGDIYLVHGNVELYNDEEVRKYPAIKDYGQAASLEVDGFKVGMVHEKWKIDRLLGKENYAVIFYGHSHKPWEEEYHGTKILNPGTLGGVFQKATCAYWDTSENNFQLILIDELDDKDK